MNVDNSKLDTKIALKLIFAERNGVRNSLEGKVHTKH